MRLIAFTVILAFLGQAASLALKGGRSFVITGSDSANAVFSRTKRDASGSSIKSLRVTSVIVSRFARVTSVSKMENNDDSAKEMVFSVRLPKAAFITEFNMVVGGVTFYGKVKEKEIAQLQYNTTVAKGNSAGLIVADVRETQTFDVSANVPARSSVDFHLVYQQLLTRKLGVYAHIILINPRQLIDNFGVDVYITETSGITLLSTIYPGGDGGTRSKEMRGKDAGVVEITTDIRRSRSQAKISFTPTGAEQRRFLNLVEDEQKFTVVYDVTREVLGGEIQMRNGYFVHFFAPENLPVLPMRVVFVIDRSGSMYGRKMQQTISAFVSIIKELRDSDKFNIISFSSDVTSWKSGLVDVTRGSVSDAIDYVEDITAVGGTNINGAVLKAADLLANVSMEDDASSMIILLTDGQPTSGETDTDQIRLNVKKAIAGQFSLFCLGFGEYLDHDFLKRLATENNGIARKIFEASDADLQLKGFFQEIAKPLLLNVKMSYAGANLTNVSRTDFTEYFGGSETVVVGAYDSDGQTEVCSTIRGESKDGEVIYKADGNEVDDTFQHWYRDTGVFDDFMEYLWAYFTVTNLLEKRTISEDPLEVEKMTNKVIHLALKYKFITPLTSLVVTLPEDELTTTTSDPLTISPLPTARPCYARGDSIPRHVSHPIWCPVILNPLLATRRDESYNQPVAQMPRPSSGRSILPARSSARSLRLLPPPPPPPQRKAKPVTGARSLSFTNFAPPRFQFQDRPWQDARPSPPPVPKIWKKCSQKLRGPSGTIQLTDMKGPQDVFLCRKKIRLGRGKWIDFRIEMANTTDNMVSITSMNKTVYEHKGGVSPPRYVYVESNQADVVFTVHKKDKARPGIVILFQRFSLDKDATKQTVPFDYKSISSTPNCGRNFLSSQNLTGVIASPNYPLMYPDGAHCWWNFEDDLCGHALKISFVDVDIESSVDGRCTRDKLVVIREDDKERIICGYKIPDDILVNPDGTKILFASDDALGGAGFKLRYEFLPELRDGAAVEGSGPI